MLLNPDVLKERSEEVYRNLEEGFCKKAAATGRGLSAVRLASILSGFDSETAAGCLLEMDKKRAGRVVAHMPVEFSSQMLLEMPEDDRVALLNRVPADNINDVLEGLPAEEKQRLVIKLDKKLRFHAEKTGRYSSGSSGRVMSPDFLSVQQNRTVREVLDSILFSAENFERRPYVYVLDEKSRPAGVVSVKDLLRVDKEKKVKEVMKPDIAVVGAAYPAVEAAGIIRNRRLTMLPVVGDSGTIEGVLTFDDAMKILSEEGINLMTSSAGTYEESFFTPPMKAVRGRLPWMAANVFLNMGAVAVISRFETTIAAVAILAAFIPMITDMGGNVGIQSLSVAIRSIALGEAKLRDFKKLIRKELLVGMVNGLSLGALFGLIAFALRGNPYLGLLAGVALGVNVLVAGIVGGALPFIIKTLGKDPAMMTGPFLTTITDITGVSIYLGLSTVFLIFLL